MPLKTAKLDEEETAFLEYIKNLPPGQVASTDDLAEVCGTDPDGVYWIAMGLVGRGEPVCSQSEEDEWPHFSDQKRLVYWYARGRDDLEVMQHEVIGEMVLLSEQLTGLQAALRAKPPRRHVVLERREAQTS